MRSLRLAGAGIALLVMTLGGWSIHLSHEAAVEDVNQSVGNQTIILAENLRLLFSTADAFLSTAASQMKFDGERTLLNPAEIRVLFDDWKARLPLVASFVFADARGDRLIDTRLPAGQVGENIAERDSFVWTRDDRTLRMGVRGPVETPFGLQPKVISLVRRVQDADGVFKGGVAQLIDTTALARYFASLDFRDTTAITLLRMNEDDSAGTVLARWPIAAEFIGQSVSRADSRITWLSRAPDYQIGKSFIRSEGVDRIFAIRSIGDYALSVSVSRNWDEAFEDWRRRAIVIALISAAASLLLFASFNALSRQIEARIRLERRASESLAERRWAELQAQQSKLDAMARLSGGMAHEFNNLLQPLKSLSQLGRDVARGPTASLDRLANYFARIHETSELASAVASDFVTFCGASKRPAAEGDLSQGVQEAVNVIAPIAPDGVTFRLDITPGVRANFDQVGLTQVLTNLAKNAIDAARQSAGKPMLLEALFSVTRAETGDALLCVRDNGPGISEQVRVRAFEPFFTTKPANGGAGLGLAVVYGIVSAWRGRISIDNHPEGGVVVSIVIPSDAPE